MSEQKSRGFVQNNGCQAANKRVQTEECDLLCDEKFEKVFIYQKVVSVMEAGFLNSGFLFQSSWTEAVERPVSPSPEEKNHLKFGPQSSIYLCFLSVQELFIFILSSVVIMDFRQYICVTVFYLFW